MIRFVDLRAALPAAALVALLAWPSFAVAQSTGSSTGRDATATGTSRAFNPAISLNTLFLGHLVSGLEEEDHAEEGGEHAHFEEGMAVQEMELQFTADIDAYSRADATIAYHEGAFEVEEAFVRTQRLPAGLGLRVGQMYVPFSNENTLHTHQLPFVQRSLVLSAISEEGLSDVGAELRYLTRAPFYLELRTAVFDGGRAEEEHEEEAGAEEHDHGSLFAAPEGEDFAYHFGIASLWELGESSTFALDGGYVFGRNGLSEANSTNTQIISGAATFRWKPTRRTIYRGLRLSAEYTYADMESELEELPSSFMSGWNTYAQFQFARRWWMQARFDQFDPTLGAPSQWRTGASLAFVPSEFQSLKLEVSQVDSDEDTFTEFFLQYNFTIGSHPAHRY